MFLLYLNSQVTVSVVNIVNNVVRAVDNDESPGGENMLDNAISNNLMDILVNFERQIERAASSGKAIPPVVENNIIFTTTNVPPRTSALSFAMTDGNSDESEENNGFNNKTVGLDNSIQPKDNDVRTSISLPAIIFQESNSKWPVV